MRQTSNLNVDHDQLNCSKIIQSPAAKHSLYCITFAFGLCSKIKEPKVHTYLHQPISSFTSGVLRETYFLFVLFANLGFAPKCQLHTHIHTKGIRIIETSKVAKQTKQQGLFLNTPQSIEKDSCIIIEYNLDYIIRK